MASPSAPAVAAEGPGDSFPPLAIRTELRMSRMSADDLFVVDDPDEMRALARELFTVLLRAGEAYSIGGDYTDVNGLAADLDANLVVAARPGGVAVYRTHDGRAVLVTADPGIDEPGTWAVDVLPKSAGDEMNRPGGSLNDRADYDELQMAAEEAAAANTWPDPFEQVLGGPESDWDDGRPRLADARDDTEPPTAAADIVADLMSERADAQKLLDRLDADRDYPEKGDDDAAETAQPESGPGDTPDRDAGPSRPE